jgi:hypothetical protein
MMFQLLAAFAVLLAASTAEARTCAHRPVNPACAYFSCAHWGKCQSGGRETQGCLRYTCRIENKNFRAGPQSGGSGKWQPPRFKMPPAPKPHFPKRPPPLSNPLDRDKR